MSDLLERLEARATPDQVPGVRHPLNYNYPLAWYRRPDGDIVQLQSDPNNRTMYEDLGFVLLRPSEAREWVEEVRPEVIAAQKKRAAVITAIRRLETRIPQFVIENEENLSYSNLNLEELEELLDEYCEQFSIKKRLPPIPKEKEAAPEAAMSGVEIHGGGELEGKLARGQGYDPIDQSRRKR